MANNADIIKIGFDYRSSLAQFEKETNGVFDGISKKAGNQKIVIQLDAKNDKVIEKIKELQKLKLDKFTFEFGDSGIKEQLKTFGQLENKINEIINLSKGLSETISKTNFGTKNKTEAYNQLKQMADVFKNFYSNEEAMHTKAGTDAAYAYYKAYKEALRKGVAESKLQKVTVDVNPTDSFFTADKLVYDRMQQYDNELHYGEISDLTEEISILESRLIKFNEAYAKVKTNLGEAPITPEIVKNIEEYVRYLEIAEARERDTSLGFTKDDIEGMRDIANMNLGFAMDSAIEENKKYVSSLKEVKKVAEDTNESINELGTDKSNISSVSSAQIKDVFQGENKSVTDASTAAIKEENEVLKQIPNSANEAANAKEKFANANKEVKASAETSKVSISEEEKYFNSLGESLEKYENTLTSISRKPIEKNRSPELQKNIVNISSSLDKLKDLKSKTEEDGYIFNKNDVETGRELENTIKENIEAVKQMSAAQKGSTPLSRGKTIEWANDLMEKNTKWSKAAKIEVQAWIDKLATADPSNVEEIRNEILKVVRVEREAGREGRTWFDIFKDKKVYSFLGQAASMFSFYDVINVAKQGVETIRELDTALVDLKKTTAMNSSQLEEFYFDSNDVAKQMGVTTQEIIDQASAWSRLGFSTQQASTQMAELSAQFAAISPGMDLDTATDGLVSSMKAFGIDVENVEREIMDNINRIGNTAATSNDEIVDMLTRSSAAMAAANNTIEETIALETAAVEITRSAETTGTAFKTISMRIRGYDEETEELSDDLKNISGDIADLTKTASTPGGISLFTDDTKETYKSTYQILKEISDIYDELSDKNRANNYCPYVQKCA